MRRRLGALRLALLAAALIVLAQPASAGAFVYWADSNGATIGRAMLDGSGVNQSFISRAASGVAVDAQHVYWSRGTVGPTIMRANLDGSGLDETFITDVSNSPGMAVDAHHIFWTGFQSESIGRANLDGTDGDQSFISGASFPWGVAVDGSHIYWTNRGAHTIGRANLDGSSPNQSFITGASTPLGVAVDGSHVYWANQAAGTIGRANLDGTGVDQSFIGSAAGPTGVAVDSNHIYWANASSGTIGRANLDGSSPNQSFITGAGIPLGVALDALPASPTLSTTASPSITLPGSVHDTATLADGASPTGTITFRLYGPDDADCSNAPVFTDPVPVAGNGEYDSGDFTPTASGIYRWIADYSGDDSNEAEASSCNAPNQSVTVSSPSNAFTLTKPKLNRRKGIATLTATVPGPGAIVLRGRGLKRQAKAAPGAGRVRLVVRPAKRLARMLKRKGKAKRTAKVIYTPTGGKPHTKQVKLTLKRRRR